MKILLISGHGEGDSGACGNGFKECDKTRELVNLITPKLKQYASVDVYDQSRNAFKDVQNGCFKIGKYDYALEIHFNAFHNPQAHGSECFVTSREKGITVEQAIMKNMKRFFTLRDNDSIFDGVKRTNFLVINTLKSKGISGALLETCFITNKTEMNVYEASKEQIAEAIVDGIVYGFGLKKKKPAKPQKPETPKKPDWQSMTNEQIAHEIVHGKNIWGNGEKRRLSLGDRYDAVQKIINAKYY